MDLQRNMTAITAECLCKSHKLSFEVSTSKLPLECNVCHCDSCRHSTGALFVIKTTWPQPRESVDISGLQRYQLSANITYLFCGTCSTLMFYESVRYPSKLGVFYGPLKNLDIDLIKLTKQIYVHDTDDGGASFWFRKPNADGKEIPRYGEQVSEDEELDYYWPWVNLFGRDRLQEKRPTSISCHCKGINLLLHLENYNTEDREELPWFIDPKTNNPIAGFAAHDPCHPYSSNEIINWVFVDLGIISQGNGRAFPRTVAKLKAAIDAGESTVGTLTCYQPSSEVQRYFCKVCSASVFYTCSKRPEIIGVAMGLLKAMGGVRADSCLSWNYGDISTSLGDATGGWRGRLIKRVQADAEEYLSDEWSRSISVTIG
ncbi:Mss4-like protein [Xylaria scruposa]|nr:Mss4-like protein [Xylaria scruposa]